MRKPGPRGRAFLLRFVDRFPAGARNKGGSVSAMGGKPKIWAEWDLYGGRQTTWRLGSRKAIFSRRALIAVKFSKLISGLHFS
jgi:hypothetical protein